MADFSLLRPANDPVALELSNWCGFLISAIGRGGHSIANSVHGTASSAVTRNAVTRALSGVRCVLFFGHGRDGELLGASGAALVDTANVGQAKNAILVAVACLSAKVLGPDACNQGVEAYLGFRDRLVWVTNDPDGQFAPAATSGVVRMLAGGDAGDALHEMHHAFGAVVDYYLVGNGKSSPNRVLGWTTAFWDQQQLELHGVSSATL